MRLWTDYLEKKEVTLGQKTVDKWLRSLKVKDYDAANLYLEASDTFQAQWFEEYIRPSLPLEFKSENGRQIKVHLEVQNRKNIQAIEKDSKQKEDFSFPDDSIEPQHTLESFVFNKKNRILQSLSEQFTSFSTTSLPYNPIYIYGKKGLGKTHLLQAITHSLREQKVKAHYVRLTSFMDHMVKAMKTSKMLEFRKHYRACDVLLVDDLEHLSYKSATQEEFFHTFNALHNEGKQIVLGASYSPGQLKSIEPRLVSRFEWGIVLPLNPPEEPDLGRILDTKIKQLNFPLNSQAKNFLIKRFSNHPHILQKALNALVLRAHLRLPQGKKLKSSYLTTGSLEMLLSDFIQKQESVQINEERILSKVSHFFGLRRQDILGKSQSRECAWPRQICMYFFRELLKMPYMQIGRFFDRDHSTVMSSVRQVLKNLEDPSHESFKVVHALKEKITQSRYPERVESKS